MTSVRVWLLRFAPAVGLAVPGCLDPFPEDPGETPSGDFAAVQPLPGNTVPATVGPLGSAAASTSAGTSAASTSAGGAGATGATGGTGGTGNHTGTVVENGNTQPTASSSATAGVSPVAPPTEAPVDPGASSGPAPMGTTDDETSEGAGGGGLADVGDAGADADADADPNDFKVEDGQ